MESSHITQLGHIPEFDKLRLCMELEAIQMIMELVCSFYVKRKSFDEDLRALLDELHAFKDSPVPLCCTSRRHAPLSDHEVRISPVQHQSSSIWCCRTDFVLGE